jgi:Arc/MetJ family transcription regulator
MTAAKMELAIDVAALAEAAEFFGTSSDVETVNMALREVMVRVRRARALAGLVEVAKTGQFDELLDKGTARR